MVTKLVWAWERGGGYGTEIQLSLVLFRGGGGEVVAAIPFDLAYEKKSEADLGYSCVLKLFCTSSWPFETKLGVRLIRVGRRPLQLRGVLCCVLEVAAFSRRGAQSMLKHDGWRVTASRV